MSPFKSSLLAASIAAALTTGCLYFVHTSRAREAASLRFANDRMRFDASQRRQTQLATASPAAVRPPDSAPQPVPADAAPLPRPPENYRDEGRATPVAALQTYAWACDRGDTGTVVKMLHIDEAARVKAEAYRASLPDNIRNQWPSLDEMAAAMLTESVMRHPFPSADILDTATVEPLGAARVRVRLPGTPKDRTEFQKTADGWSYVITEAAVDAYLAQAAARRATP